MNRPDRSARRLLGKSDPLDAQAAARAVLSGHARARAKSGAGPVHSARMFKLAKDSAVKARIQAINQLKAVLVIADEAHEGAVLHATHITLCLLDRRIRQLSEQVRELEGRLTRLVERHAPQLLEVAGIGPDTAVTLLITIGDNPERLGSEASFAALCGVSPVERSSGSRRYRRLNRGGDRQANAAPQQGGQTRREIVRSLKRYVAREVFTWSDLCSRNPRQRGSRDT